jgi:hypothetical protein
MSSSNFKSRSLCVSLSSLALAGLFACTGTDDTPELSGAPGPGEAVETEALGASLPAKKSVRNLVKIDERYKVTAELKTVAGVRIPSGTRLIALRSFLLAGAEAVLAINADTLATATYLRATLAAAATRSEISDTPYDRARSRAATTEGVVRAFASDAATSAKGPEVALTVDMCQSSKPWDKDLFDWAVAQGESLGRPIDVGIAMTGGWASRHPSEFSQLQSWNANGKLAIRWVNHSLTHPLHCNAGNSSCAFLTAPGVDMQAEVLGMEKLLLEQGETPSLAFRFPGLVHNAATRKQVSALGLFGLDANAWLALGQPIKAGSVILVHGNGNERPGIKLFLDAMRAGAFAGGEAAGKLRFVPIERVLK